MNDHVSKPIDPNSLFSTLMRWAKPRPKPQAESREIASAKECGKVVLPEIGGINLVDGLKRVSGNRRLYRDLLVRFVANEDAAAQISAALESGDLKLAECIAHTVKGVAGNLGITKVQSTAQKLEEALHEGEKKVLRLLVEFASVMGAQVHAIETALCDSAATPQEEAQNVPFEPEVAAVEIARLRILLETSDGDAEESFRKVRNAVAGAVEKPQLDGLSASIHDFDFTAALAKLDEIAEYCARNEKHS
jgi:HPt (histidine-containing phosphotransfer) domain-containing protein